ncbi:hypothetical protein Tsubulata_015696 [Turnera subulata]|uniref:Tubby C-terminal domain-containing protein n=1 Tax=Turnera subulata TaxID=218843 RepID=A0A9Q0G0Q5_9ROSI|nr:hypothetical protein Tsubulata_015696 [Turnera subulata]
MPSNGMLRKLCKCGIVRRFSIGNDGGGGRWDGRPGRWVNKMHRKHSVSTFVFDADSFAVTVYPNVDYAFVVALVVLLDEINDDRSGGD